MVKLSKFTKEQEGFWRLLSKQNTGVNIGVHLAISLNVTSTMMAYFALSKKGECLVDKVSTSALLERALAAASLRQKLLANNLANVDTPGYKRFDLAMKAALHQNMNSPLENSIYRQAGTSLRLDGNNVDVEQEMTYVAENEAYFNAVANSLIKQLATLRYLITEGRR